MNIPPKDMSLCIGHNKCTCLIKGTCYRWHEHHKEHLDGCRSTFNGEFNPTTLECRFYQKITEKDY